MKQLNESHYKAAKMIWQGLGNQEIAEALGVSASAIRNWRNDDGIKSVIETYRKKHLEAEAVTFELAMQQAQTQRGHVYEMGELIHRLVRERLELLEGNLAEPLPRGMNQWAELYITHVKAIGELDYRILGLEEVIDVIKQTGRVRSIESAKSLQKPSSRPLTGS